MAAVLWFYCRLRYKKMAALVLLYLRGLREPIGAVSTACGMRGPASRGRKSAFFSPVFSAAGSFELGNDRGGT